MVVVFGVFGGFELESGRRWGGLLMDRDGVREVSKWVGGK